MSNPWLNIPLADYEQHMSLPSIAQAQMLSDELASAVRKCRPKSVAVIGCAGGNGFDRLVGTSVCRIVGVDINPDYVAAARRLYAQRLPGTEFHIADIQESRELFKPVDLLFAALILEYVDVPKAMSVFRSLQARDGSLVIVLQAADALLGAISRSPYKSLERLAASMQIRDPTSVREYAVAAGFCPKSSRTVSLPSGKRFTVMSFRD